MLSKPFVLGCLLFIAGACVFSPGCAGQRQPQKTPPPPRQAVLEAPPPPPETNPTPDTAAATNAPGHPPPANAEANGAVERVFKGVVTIETGREPYFVVGNFNDDSAQDIAVVVKPAPGKLPEINDELASWILVAPALPATPAPKDLPYAEVHAKAVRRRVVVEEGDTLLAVIHGFGPDGWRDSQATQTYVLKNAAGDKMKTQERKHVLKADGREKLPRLRGDVIAQTVGGQSGFLYYDGAKYAWYDPRSYKPAPPARVVHGGATVAAQQ